MSESTSGTPAHTTGRALSASGQSPVRIFYRLLGAPEALAFVKANLFDAPEAAFDAAFSSGD